MENREKKTDKRVLKTKKAIRIAFARLLAEKDIDAITVKELSERAGINRKTFYNYYSSVYQVLDEIEGELARLIEEEQKKVDLRRGQKDPESLYRFLTDILGRDREFYSALLSVEGNRGLLGKVSELLRLAAAELISSQYDGPRWQIEYMAEYAVAGLLAVFRRWFVSGQDVSVNDVAALMGLLGVEGFRGWAESLGKGGNNA
jgi:AcrR family transcriptional regulator